MPCAGLQFTLRQIMVCIALVAFIFAVGRISWAAVIFGLAISGGAGLVQWEVRHGRPEVEVESGNLVFKYGGFIRALGKFLAVAVSMVAAAITCSFPTKNASEVVLLCLVFGIFVVPAWMLVWEVTQFSIVVSHDGLHFQSPWRRGFFVAWPEISQVYYELAMLWVEIHSSRGHSIHVSKYIAGIGEFLREITSRLHPSGFKPPNAGFVIIKRRLP